MDQPLLPEIKPYVNRNLFSDHFLRELLPKDESWAVDEDKVRLAIQAALNLYAPRKEELPHLNEAQLEQEFVRPLLESLGHVFQVQPSLPTSEGVRRPDYAFFATREDKRQARKHKGKLDYFKKAIAIGDAKPWGQPLDKRQRRGTDKFDMLSPSWQIDYYLRTSEAPWAILTDGRFWRLYNRETSFRLDFYYEIDLPQILAARDLEDFEYFYLFFRREAFIRDPEGLCFLDRVYQGSLEYARNVGDDLKDSVYKALRILAEGFAQTPGNNLDPGRDLETIHANALIYLYRLLFINYAEDRRLLPRDKPLYKETYGLVSMEGEIASKLERQESLSPLQATYWGKLRVLFDLINRGSEPFGIDKDTLFVPPYNGGLFDPEHHPFLEENRVADRWLAKVMDLLARSKGKGVGRAFVDYSSLDVRHLGSIYEGLLEYKLRVADEEMAAIRRRGREEWVSASEAEGKKAVERVQPGQLYLATDRGERKATGSYYTPGYVVKYIVENTLGPLIADKKKDEDPIEAILSLKVLDPAMGSGHFLVEATDRLAHALIEALGGSPDAEDDIRWARREVVERCIYGVDLNPLAVELAKLSLWLHTVAEGKPFNFLDHHLKVGNSLIGAWVEDLGSLPAQRKRVRLTDGEEVSARQMNLFEQRLNEKLPVMLGKVLEISERPTETLEDIKGKEAADQAIKELKTPFKAVADLWVSTYFGNEVRHAEYDEALHSIGEPKKLLALPTVQRAGEIAEQKRFFHWELQFPEVFYQDSKRRENAGFDAVVGNPPYDVVEKERLQDDDPYADFGLYLRRNEFFKAASGGKQNLFRPFLIVVASLVHEEGRFGQIIPLALLTDSSCSVTLESLMTTRPNLDIQAFPQKDQAKNRVFPEAKLSTCIVIGSGAEKEGIVSVRTNPGRMILPDAKQYSTTHDELSRVSGGKASIPLASSREWGLIRRLRLDARMIGVDSIVDLSRGEINQTIYREYITDNANCEEMLKGSEIGFYEEQAPSQGSKEWFDNDLYQRQTGRRKLVPPFRIALQRISGVDDARRLTGTIADRKVHFADSLNSLSGGDMQVLRFTLALLNSKLLNWCFRVFSTNNNVSTGELAALPIPPIDFTTPSDRREQLAEKGRKLYESCLSEGYGCLLEFVEDHMARDATEVIHDLLAHLAAQMIEMNKGKQAESKGFLDWLAGYTGLPIEDWHLKTLIQSYWEHRWDDIRRALSENRKAIEQASGRNVEGREALEAIQGEYDQSVAKLEPLLQRIASTDRLIDLIVYRLYGLTEEEVAIVEGE